MFSKETYINRRNALRKKMESRGILLFPANELSPNSYPSNSYYFRQDATFRYFFESENPALWGVLDLDTGHDVLYGEDVSLDDIIWTGVQPTIRDIAERSGIDRCGTISDLQHYISESQRQNRKIHILPPYRGETKISLARLLNTTIEELDNLLSPDLIFAVAELREVKSSEEIEALEEAFDIGYELHTTAMKMCRAGVIEREIGGTLEGIARTLGNGVSFPPICTQHGETLHNIYREGELKAGRLFLCDAGGESLKGYCSDHTRTYPISNKFTDIQRDIYSVALHAYENTKHIARAGLLYQDLQRATLRTIGEGLRDLGFLNGSTEEVTDAAMLFMPHGVGHGLGLDVHDCEAMGERTFNVERFAEHAARSTSCIVRSRWVLSAGTVMTNEPGIYFIPALIEKRRAEGTYRGIVDFDKVTKYLNFGGIRIEDDIVIQENGCKQIGSRNIPVTVTELENYRAQWI